MKADEPFIAVFFKGISIVVALIALFTAVTGGFAEIITAVYLLLGAAPAAWWMGEVVGLLGRIAANAEQRQSARASAVLPITPSEAAKQSIFKSKEAVEDDVPTFKI